MTRIGFHDVACGHRPVNPLNLVLRRVMDQNRRCLRRLTVPHFKIFADMLKKKRTKVLMFFLVGFLSETEVYKENMLTKDVDGD